MLEIVMPKDTEVSAAPKRRTFTAEYRRRIVKEAAACTKPGEIGALLRREGLYSSHLVSWRRAAEKGELSALSPKKRGANKREAVRAELPLLLHALNASLIQLVGIQRENGSLPPVSTIKGRMLDVAREVAGKDIVRDALIESIYERRLR